MGGIVRHPSHDLVSHLQSIFSGEANVDPAEDAAFAAIFRSGGKRPVLEHVSGEGLAAVLKGKRVISVEAA